MPKLPPFLILISFFFFSALNAEKTVYLIPFDGFSFESLFENPSLFKGEVLNPWYTLREELEKGGYEVKSTFSAENLDNPTAIISFNRIHIPLLLNLLLYPKERCFLFCFEPPVVLPNLYAPHLSRFFGKIFVMFDDLIDEERYFKFCYPQPRLKRIESIPSFEEKKFCALINNNKDFPHHQSLYEERRKVIAFYASLPKGEFDLYGSGWQGYRDWKGTVPNKWETLKHYKFCYCFENTQKQEGYITEKIFDCLVGGCVPIYWGADNITAYIPKECFIDRRDFSSDEDLYWFLKSITPEEYEGYAQAATAFLTSAEAKRFSAWSYAQLILDALSHLDQND